MSEDRLQRYKDDDAFLGAVLGFLAGPPVGAVIGAIVGLIATGSAWPAAGMGVMPIGSLGGPIVLGSIGAISNHRKAKERVKRVEQGPTMATWNKTEDTFGNTVYTLPARTNWTEVAKLYPLLQKEAQDSNDDAVIVLADENRIRFVIVTEPCPYSHSHTRDRCGHPICPTE